MPRWTIWIAGVWAIGVVWSSSTPVDLGLVELIIPVVGLAIFVALVAGLCLRAAIWATFALSARLILERTKPLIWVGLVFALAVGLGLSPLPLRYRFLLSRPSFEKYIASWDGSPVEVNRWIGAFWITRIEPVDGGAALYVIPPKEPLPTGFVFRKEGPPRIVDITDDCGFVEPLGPPDWYEFAAEYDKMQFMKSQWLPRAYPNFPPHP